MQIYGSKCSSLCLKHVVIFPAFGELVLREKKEMRDMKQRLMLIEEQLQRFQNDDHDDVSWKTKTYCLNGTAAAIPACVKPIYILAIICSLSHTMIVSSCSVFCLSPYYDIYWMIVPGRPLKLQLYSIEFHPHQRVMTRHPVLITVQSSRVSRHHPWRSSDVM